MTQEERQALLERILSNISSIQMRVSKMDYETFRQEESVRQEIYSELQEIGQNAGEYLQADDTPLDLRNDLELLKRFSGATHNQYAEVNHQATWQVAQNDLQTIGQRIEQSEVYAP